MNPSFPLSVFPFSSMKRPFRLACSAALCLVLSACSADKEVSLQVVSSSSLQQGAAAEAEIAGGMQVSCIPLESKAECLMGYVSRVVAYEGSFYLQAQDGRGGERLFVFDKAGKFLRTIGMRGNGSGEYLQMGAFFIADGRVYILDAIKKNLLCYDMSGRYLHSLSADDSVQFVRGLYPLPKGRVLSLQGIHFGDDRSLYRLFSLDKTFKPGQVVAHTPYTYSGDRPFAQNAVAETEDAYLLLYPLEKQVYALDKATFAISPRLRVEYGGKLQETKSTDYDQAAEEAQREGGKLLWGLYAAQDKLLLQFLDESLVWDLSLQKGVVVDATSLSDSECFPFQGSLIRGADEGFLAVFPADFFNATVRALQESGKAIPEGAEAAPGSDDSANPVLVRYSF